MGNSPQIKARKPVASQSSECSCKPAFMELHQAVRSYEYVIQYNSQIQGVISREEVNKLKGVLENQNKLQVINNYKPGQNFPFLNPLRRTIWKLLLIMPALFDFPEESFLEMHQKSKDWDMNEQYLSSIEKDSMRTFPTSQSLNQESLKNLLLILYGSIFKPLGYYSGESFILGFLLQCGFEQNQAFCLYVALKINKKFQFVRRVHTKQQYQDTISYKLSKAFSLCLKTKYPEIYEVFDKFDVEPALVCISDFMCLCCNWDYDKIGSVVMIWDFIICYTGQLCSFACIYTQLAKLWYQKEAKLHLKTSSSQQLFKKWLDFRNNISKVDIQMSLKIVTEDLIKKRIFSTLDNFGLLNSVFAEIYDKKQPHEQYLRNICGPIKKYSIQIPKEQDQKQKAQQIKQ